MSEWMRNPLVLILIAAVTGSGSGSYFGRPDAHTGSDDKRARTEDRLEMRKYVDDKIDAHLKAAEQWKDQIRSLQWQVQKIERRLGEQ